VLWLTASRDPALRAALAGAAAERGIDPARLIYAERVPDKAMHLARHRHADLFLDTFKFNASTTALDALWAGLPVLTRAGQSFHSRIGASYLRALGLDTLICADTDSYVARAAALAADPEERADLRAALDAARPVMPLFDEARFVRHLESAYQRMWWQFSSGAGPVGFDVTASAPRLNTPAV
jgi:predicted O-linked N-acetylglucosamine transferase (SPINDLY family)